MPIKKYEDLTRAELDIYRKFFEWQKTSYYGLPGGEKYLPIIAARYTLEEADLLTGIPGRINSRPSAE